jgi:hypothetical protein
MIIMITIVYRVDSGRPLGGVYYRFVEISLLLRVYPQGSSFLSSCSDISFVCQPLFSYGGGRTGHRLASQAVPA